MVITDSWSLSIDIRDETNTSLWVCSKENVIYI